MGLASLTVLGLSTVIVTATLNLVGGWTLSSSMCPGSDAFCDGVYWSHVVDYLPAWLFIAQLLVVLALASPFALFRTGR